jgi:hypothetical protein
MQRPYAENGGTDSYLQMSGSAPRGNIRLQPITMVTTDCITGGDEDHIEMELQRNVASNWRVVVSGVLSS